MDLRRNYPNGFFDWLQHSPFDSKFLQFFCKSSKKFKNEKNQNQYQRFLIILDNTKNDAICNRASYFCESDIQNNFTIRRQPSFFCEAVANCTIENSFLTSSKSVSEINYAKNGFSGGLDHLRMLQRILFFLNCVGRPKPFFVHIKGSSASCDFWKQYSESREKTKSDELRVSISFFFLGWFTPYLYHVNKNPI